MKKSVWVTLLCAFVMTATGCGKKEPPPPAPPPYSSSDDSAPAPAPPPDDNSNSSRFSANKITLESLSERSFVFNGERLITCVGNFTVENNSGKDIELEKAYYSISKDHEALDEVVTAGEKYGVIKSGSVHKVSGSLISDNDLARYYSFGTNIKTGACPKDKFLVFNKNKLDGFEYNSLVPGIKWKADQDLGNLERMSFDSSKRNINLSTFDRSSKLAGNMYKSKYGKNYEFCGSRYPILTPTIINFDDLMLNKLNLVELSISMKQSNAGCFVGIFEFLTMAYNNQVFVNFEGDRIVCIQKSEDEQLKASKLSRGETYAVLGSFSRIDQYIWLEECSFKQI